jgi:NAD-dependent SIR2 family protein deacetylase
MIAAMEHALDDALDDTIERAARLIEQADALVVAAGAGMGVDSGLPDFRGNQGFWNAYPALGRRELDFAQVASPSTFDTDPRLAWGFYGHRLTLYRETVPHAGFGILREWAARMPRGAFVFTSNVDGQFQRAGYARDAIQECHGSIHWLQCSSPCCDEIWSAEDLQPDVDTDACKWKCALPTCPRCGELARPNILMFGDPAWLEGRADRQQEQLAAWLARVQRPVVVELGAGTGIPTVRHFSQRVVRAHGGRLVRINVRESEVPTPLDVGLPVGALEGLRRIAQRMG